MTFKVERLRAGDYDASGAEHQVLIRWTRQNPHRAVPEYLDHRVVDPERGIAVYYIHGIGMGYGRTFALVRGTHVILFDACETNRGVQLDPTIRISGIELPEELWNQRDRIQSLITEAYACYGNEFPMRIFIEGTVFNFTFQVDEASWRIVPTRYSRLYWRREAAKLWSRTKPSLAKIRDYLCSPLAGLLGLALLMLVQYAGKPVSPYAFFALGGWLCWRLLRYDDDYVFGYWFMGRIKLRNPFGHILTLNRILEPKPLDALMVKLYRPSTQHPGEYKVRVENRSWLPVPYFSISASDIADVVASGLTTSLRAKNDGAINPKELEASFSSLQRRWILPRQTVEWRVTMLEAFPEMATSTRIQAVINLPRLVSGETKPGPRIFVLPLEILVNS